MLDIITKINDIKKILDKIENISLPDSLLDEYTENVLKESDRGCVIVSADMLDSSLESLLRLSFRHDKKDHKITNGLFLTYAPLSTFAAKINICYASELISNKMYSSLNTIRKMRNRFAHSRQVIDFQDQSNNDLLSVLISIRGASTGDELYSTLPDSIKNRRMFSLCVIHLLSKINCISTAINEGIYHKLITAALDHSEL